MEFIKLFYIYICRGEVYKHIHIYIYITISIHPIIINVINQTKQQKIGKKQKKKKEKQILKHNGKTLHMLINNNY